MKWDNIISSVIQGTKDLDANIRDMIVATLHKSRKDEYNEMFNPWIPEFTIHEYGIKESSFPANFCEIKKFNYNNEIVEVRYDHNNYGFRCEDMSEKKDNEFVVLTTGDSTTYGCGLPIECRYSDIICNELQLNEDKIIKNYNIALPGHSNDYIVRSLYKGINTFKPDLVLFLYTYRNRFEHYENNDVKQITTDVVNKEFFALTTEDHMMYSSFKNFAFIDLLFNVVDIPYYYGSLDPKIQTAISIHPNFIGKFNLDQEAFDNEHPGSNKHKEIANLFLNKYYNDKETRRNI